MFFYKNPRVVGSENWQDVVIVRGQSSSAGIGMVAEMVAQHQECHWLMCGAMSQKPWKQKSTFNSKAFMLFTSFHICVSLICDQA